MRRLSALLCAAALLAAFSTTALAAAPLNDEPSGATVVSSLPFVDAIDTTEATIGADDQVCWDEPAVTNTVWYSFTAPTTEVVIVSTQGSAFQTKILGLDNGVFNDCRTDYYWLEAEAGHTYSIMIGGAYGAGGGSLVVNMWRYYEALEWDLVVTGARIVSGELLVSGTTTINAGVMSSSTLTVDVTQQKGRNYTHGRSVTLSDPSLSWEIAVPADEGTSWFSGNATVRVAFEAVDEASIAEQRTYQAVVRVPKVPKR